MASKRRTHDSSITRVQPVLRQLFRKDHKGITWLANLLLMGSRSGEVLSQPGPPGWTGELIRPPQPLRHLASEKELRAAAPVDYLRYLVEHPALLNWPSNLPLRIGSQTPLKRNALHDENPVLRQEALGQLAVGHTHRGWWVFEGTTSVDAVLRTKNVTVFIEGKRTESQLTAKTKWDAQRHQVFRNLDCLRALANPPRAERFYMLLIVEENTRPAVEAAALDGDFAAARNSWPQLNDEQAQDLWGHYLGYTTWQKLAAAFSLQLPDTRDEAALICPNYVHDS